MNKLKISKEFKQFGRMFIQDLHLFGEKPKEIIDYIIRNYDDKKSKDLKNFISQILASQLTDKELFQLWAATDSDIYFHTAEGLKAFLRMTRDRL